MPAFTPVSFTCDQRNISLYNKVVETSGKDTKDMIVMCLLSRLRLHEGSE